MSDRVQVCEVCGLEYPCRCWFQSTAPDATSNQDRDEMIREQARHAAETVAGRDHPTAATVFDPVGHQTSNRAAIEDALRGHVADIELDLCVDRLLAIPKRAQVTPEVVERLEEAEDNIAQIVSEEAHHTAKREAKMNDEIRDEIERLTDRLADERGGDYLDESVDAGYYAALDDLRALVGLPPTDRRRRD